MKFLRLSRFLALALALAAASPLSAEESASVDLTQRAQTAFAQAKPESIAVKNFNLLLKTAARQKLPWIYQPAAVALQFIATLNPGPFEVRSQTIVVTSAGPEDFSAVSVAITNFGYLDDKTAGEQFTFALARQPDATWRLVSGEQRGILWRDLRP
jgi:hypothetical protein